MITSNQSSPTCEQRERVDRNRQTGRRAALHHDLNPKRLSFSLSLPPSLPRSLARSLARSLPPPSLFSPLSARHPPRAQPPRPAHSDVRRWAPHARWPRASMRPPCCSCCTRARPPRSQLRPGESGKMHGAPLVRRSDRRHKRARAGGSVRIQGSSFAPVAGRPAASLSPYLNPDSTRYTLHPTPCGALVSAQAATRGLNQKL